MGLPSSIRATANPLIQSMDLAGETKKQPFWQHGGTILLDSQAATIKGHCYMWLSWLPILHRHTSCGSPIMHGCTNSRLHFCFQGTTEPYQIRATLKDPVLNAKVYTQQAMLPNSLAATSRPALIQRMAEMQTHTLAKKQSLHAEGLYGENWPAPWCIKDLAQSMSFFSVALNSSAVVHNSFCFSRSLFKASSCIL
jgi:hypothetical protein